MAHGTCMADACERPVGCRGYCMPCYRRLRKDGTLPKLPELPPLRERFMDAIRVTASDCWEWQAARNDLGYGHLWMGDGKFAYAHRFSYEKHVGPIPEGYDLDHLCRNPPCCNPDHLEPVTHAENLHRSPTPSFAAYRDGRCMRNHKMSGDNLYIFPDGKRRGCRACGRIRDKRRRRDSGAKRPGDRGVAVGRRTPEPLLLW